MTTTMCSLTPLCSAASKGDVTDKDLEQGDPAEMDVDEIIAADMAMGEWRRRLVRENAGNENRCPVRIPQRVFPSP